MIWNYVVWDEDVSKLIGFGYDKKNRFVLWDLFMD